MLILAVCAGLLSGSGEWDLNGLEKDLTVLLPEELLLKELKINGLSAEMEVDSISGTLLLSVGEAPDSIDISTGSGAVILILPKDTGMTLHFSTVSGNFHQSCPVRRMERILFSGMVPASAALKRLRAIREYKSTTVKRRTQNE